MIAVARALSREERSKIAFPPEYPTTHSNMWQHDTMRSRTILEMRKRYPNMSRQAIEQAVDIACARVFAEPPKMRPIARAIQELYAQ